MINIKDLYFEYPKSNFKFHVPHLQIEPGSKLAIIGPSGSGKTTLLNLISAISVPSKGEIVVDGVNLDSLNDATRRNYRISRIGFVFQDFELIEYLNLIDNILLSYRINPSLNLTMDVKKRAQELAESMGLGDKLTRNVTKLSQGEKQRAAICRSLLTEPPLILADEPTGNLDPDNKNHVLEILFNYSDENKSTLIIVTHDHTLLEGFDRVIDLQDFN